MTGAALWQSMLSCMLYMSTLCKTHVCCEAFFWVQQRSCQHMLCVQMSVVRSENMLVLRSTCINMVLGTDMKKHFDIVSRFQVHTRPACFVLHECDM